MRKTGLAVVAAVVWAASGTAWADDAMRAEAPREDAAGPPAMTSREIRRSLDAYFAGSEGDATLVGGPGVAGYDGTFWVRGGSFVFRTGLLMQTRFEGFDWDDKENESQPGGDLSGFSLPRVSWWVGGQATCNMAYYAELEFGHAVRPAVSGGLSDLLPQSDEGVAGMVYYQSQDLPILREAWIGWQFGRGSRGWGGPVLHDTEFPGLQVGIVRTAGSRQLMTPPEQQQFGEISLGAAWIASQMPGYTDRNRDLGLRWDVLSVVRSTSNFNGFLTVTNGDGPDVRNVLDELSDDHIAFSGRFDYEGGPRRYVLPEIRSQYQVYLPHEDQIGRFDETGLGAREGEFRWGVGAWGYTLQHARDHDRWAAGVDAYARWGGLSLTGAYSWSKHYGHETLDDFDGESYYFQVGYNFRGSAFGVAARTSGYSDSNSWGGTEYSLGGSYSVDGWRNRVTLDVTRIQAEDMGNLFGALYPAYLPTGDGDATLVRVQWQLGL